ncbi:hypothetical protein [Halomonas sp. LBP4]|uniref:hypothetical protein n=1 Tax=Halomonas sp. LBP4 TaxID=2044917 RepID=UPI000D761813|nr:hypothetical protein [Halomonas sp. LBP4]PXX95920.1 hypothetical protein CR157_17125 [Halomonas sp. LBP4]
MLHAEAIILDRERLFDRCIHLGYPNLLGVILQHVGKAVSLAAQELNPTSPPRVFFRLQDYLAARTQGEHWHVPASMLVGTHHVAGFFQHYPHANLVAESAPDMPTGYAPGNDDAFHDWHFPALLRIGDQYWPHLPPEAQLRFPD